MIKVKDTFVPSYLCFEYSKSNDKLYEEYINRLYNFNKIIEKNQKIENNDSDEYTKLKKEVKDQLTEFASKLDTYRQLLMKKTLIDFIKSLLQYQKIDIEINKVLIISNDTHPQYLCDPSYYACPEMNNIDAITQALLYKSEFDNSLNETAKKVILSTLLPLDTLSTFPIDVDYLNNDLVFIIILDENNDYYVLINKNINKIKEVISVINEDMCNRFFKIDNNKDFQIESNFYFESITELKFQKVALLINDISINNYKHFTVELFKGDE